MHVDVFSFVLKGKGAARREEGQSLERLAKLGRVHSPRVLQVLVEVPPLLIVVPLEPARHRHSGHVRTHASSLYPERRDGRDSWYLLPVPNLLSNGRAV